MTQEVIEGDVRAVLAGRPAESVQCVVTSPPYWGLRDYGLPATVWPRLGGDSYNDEAVPGGGCEHVWGVGVPGDPRGGSGPNAKEGYGGQDGTTDYARQVARGSFCQICGAWRGCLGLEPTPELYVEHMVEVFRGVRRVLRKDGTVWLNLGDSYASGTNDRKSFRRDRAECNVVGRSVPTSAGALGALKPKDLVGIPWRVAFALQGDGWWLRTDVVWNKTNPKPEPVTDRPTRSHEYVFLLTKSARYFYDADAVREAGQACSGGRTKVPDAWDTGPGSHGTIHREGRSKGGYTTTGASGANRRSVWHIATQPFPEAHFATFPEKLVEPCVLAGTRPGDTALDPFAGSGTVGVVCKKLGRDFIGIEVKPEYCAMARRRIAETVADTGSVRIGQDSAGKALAQAGLWGES